MPPTTRAMMLHEQLIFEALSVHQQTALAVAIAHHEQQGWGGRQAKIQKLQDAAASVISEARELAIAVVAGDVAPGELVTLTQNLYFRKVDEQRGSFRGELDVDRSIKLEGTFAIDNLVTSTGRSESWGHRRFAMLAIVQSVDLMSTTRTIGLRPLFFGWRLTDTGAHGIVNDLEAVSPNWLDGCSVPAGGRPKAADRARLAAMSTDEVIAALAKRLGPLTRADDEQPPVLTGSARRDDSEVTVAVLVTGADGPLDLAGLGSRAQPIERLVATAADLWIVQHGGAVSAALHNLMRAWARTRGSRFSVIDGDLSALLFRPEV